MWFVGAVLLLLAPWLLVAASWWSADQLPPQEFAKPARATSRPAVAPAASPNPWGDLVTTPVVISPPIEYVPGQWDRVLPVEWHFPGVKMDIFMALLADLQLAPGQAAQILAATSPDPGTTGLVVRPDAALVRALSPDTRARLYPLLARSPLNDRQLNAFRFESPSADAWFAGSMAKPETIALVKPFLYSVGGFHYFADVDLVRPAISEDEWRRLAKTLFRHHALIVKVGVSDPARIDAVTEYWGRGGRRTDIRPILESLLSQADGEPLIDVVHLLPTFARAHLYRYPRVTVEDLGRPALVNCLWTAFNFFNAEVDNRFLDHTYAFDYLRKKYYIVHDGLQLGDIVAIADSEGSIFHVAVYLADGLVFSKNGTSVLAPWTILPLDSLKGFYLERADDWHLSYHRRLDF